MNFFQLPGSVIALCLIATPLHAQHDPHRNATRHIAKGEFEKASNELAKAAADDSETHFVAMMQALEQGETEAALVQARAALDAGLPIERLVAGPRPTLEKLHATAQYKRWIAEQKPSTLVHGPMIGAVTDDSASVWLRTSRAASCEVRYRVAGVKSLSEPSAPAITFAENDFVTVIALGNLAPQTSYDYEVLVDDEIQSTGHFRTFPPLGAGARFRVCFGGGAGFVPEWERMWDVILKHGPLAMLMLGDNVYIDDPEHLMTNRYCYYRRQSRPEWRRLTAATAIYSIYDDHDFGTNDCVPGPDIETPAWKRKVWNTFRQNWVNPSYGGGVEQPGCWYDFHIADVHFIMLDGRYYRTRKPDPSMLGDVQKNWLLETLKRSTATFKILASPVPFTANVKPGSKDPWDGYAAEREEIFSFIAKEKIDGVFLIAADRHRTDLRVTPRENGYDLYEFESSKLTNRHTHSVVQTPGLIWGYNKACSFALMQFDTTKIDPTVTFEAYNIDDERVHSYELRLSSLKE